ncbi:hypothetical protein IAE22_32900, partial [Bacillus sp. S34]|nr:hypothetical protein [Bacillus sp. S34]
MCPLNRGGSERGLVVVRATGGAPHVVRLCVATLLATLRGPGRVRLTATVVVPVAAVATVA